MSAETLMRQISTEWKGNAIMAASSTSPTAAAAATNAGGGQSAAAVPGTVNGSGSGYYDGTKVKSSGVPASASDHKHGRGDGPTSFSTQQLDEQQAIHTPKRPKQQHVGGVGRQQSSPPKLSPSARDTPLGLRSRTRSGARGSPHKHRRADSADELNMVESPPTARARMADGGDVDGDGGGRSTIATTGVPAAAAERRRSVELKDRLAAAASKNVKYEVTDETVGRPAGGAASAPQDPLTSAVASLLLCCSSYETEAVVGKSNKDESGGTLAPPTTEVDDTAAAGSNTNGSAASAAAAVVPYQNLPEDKVKALASRVGEDAALLLQNARRGTPRAATAPRRLGSSVAQSRAEGMEEERPVREQGQRQSRSSSAGGSADDDKAVNGGGGAGSVVSGKNKSQLSKKQSSSSGSSSFRGKIQSRLFKKMSMSSHSKLTSKESSASGGGNGDFPSLTDGGSSSCDDDDNIVDGHSGHEQAKKPRQRYSGASIVDSPSGASDGSELSGSGSINNRRESVAKSGANDIADGGEIGISTPRLSSHPEEEENGATISSSSSCSLVERECITGPPLGTYHDVIGPAGMTGDGGKELAGTYGTYRMDAKFIDKIIGRMDCVLPLHHHAHRISRPRWDSVADLKNVNGCCDNYTNLMNPAESGSAGCGYAGPDTSNAVTYNVCSEPAASTMKVRGATYVTDGIKVASKEAMFSLLGVDNIFGEGKPHCSEREHSYLNRLRSACREAGVRVPFLLVVNFVLPWGNVLAYLYRPDTSTDGGPYDASRMGSVPSERLWKEFLEGDDEYRNARLKFIPKMIAAPWIVKKMVGSNPAIIGQKLPTSYYGSADDNYLEICLDVTAGPQIANSIATTVAGKSDAVTVDLGFLIEGIVDETELPEQLLAIYRLHHVNMSTKKAYSDVTWVEEIKRRQLVRSEEEEEMPEV